MALEVASLGGADYEDVSFTVKRGEVIGLTGATSSGRTSVAEAIAGLRAPKRGDIRVAGKSLPPGDVPAALAPALAACRRTGITKAWC